MIRPAAYRISHLCFQVGVPTFSVLLLSESPLSFSGRNTLLAILGTVPAATRRSGLSGMLRAVVGGVEAAGCRCLRVCLGVWRYLRI